ncbi:uncharacterized protein LOC126718123 [Quercus robur]|uniref:uncharacterized protein LOC126718123 n=1 Tax=Quercus robur TaxID=38942 RepID=UPI0021625B53|nr:uncharacterized protein LOC126718123 [Quercus robur]
MAPIKAEKLRAMNSYNKGQFLYNLILHALVALSCSLLCSYPNWFPSLRYSMKHFLFTSLPNLSSFLVNPKCVFIIFNVIVVFLMGESKLVGSNTSPSNEIYDEYVERSQSLRGRSHSTFEEREERTVETNISDTHEGYNMGDQSLKGDSTLQEKKEERKLEMNLVEDKVNRIETKELVKEVVEVEDDDGDDGEAEEEAGLPVEELNKKAEEFIARVNKQMWLEAKLSVCTEA